MNEFIDIPGYEGMYKINKQGVVISLINKEQNFVKKQSVDKKGHVVVCMYNGRRFRPIKLYRLMIAAFTDNKDDKCRVVHKDGNKLNNKLDNLKII